MPKSARAVAEATTAVQAALRGHPGGLTRLPAAPGHLSPEMAAWWADIVATYSLEQHHLRLLEGAAVAWDRAQAARQAIETAGLFVQDRFGQQQEHPAVAVERASWQLFARLTRECGLDLVKPAAPRLPTRWRSA